MNKCLHAEAGVTYLDDPEIEPELAVELTVELSVEFLVEAQLQVVL